MDLSALTALLTGLGLSPAIIGSIMTIVTALVTICSFLLTVWKTPAEGSPWSIPYALVSFIALNMGHAKTAGTAAPAVDDKPAQ